MKRILPIFAMLFICATAFGQGLKATGWTTNTDPAAARTALGITGTGSDTNALRTNDTREVIWTLPADKVVRVQTIVTNYSTTNTLVITTNTALTNGIVITGAGTTSVNTTYVWNPAYGKWIATNDINTRISLTNTGGGAGLILQFNGILEVARYGGNGQFPTNWVRLGSGLLPSPTGKYITAAYYTTNFAAATNITYSTNFVFIKNGLITSSEGMSSSGSGQSFTATPFGIAMVETSPRYTGFFSASVLDQFALDEGFVSEFTPGFADFINNETLDETHITPKSVNVTNKTSHSYVYSLVGEEDDEETVTVATSGKVKAARMTSPSGDTQPIKSDPDALAIFNDALGLNGSYLSGPDGFVRPVNGPAILDGVVLSGPGGDPVATNVLGTTANTGTFRYIDFTNTFTIYSGTKSSAYTYDIFGFQHFFGTDGLPKYKLLVNEDGGLTIYTEAGAPLETLSSDGSKSILGRVTAYGFTSTESNSLVIGAGGELDLTAQFINFRGNNSVKGVPGQVLSPNPTGLHWTNLTYADLSGAPPFYTGSTNIGNLATSLTIAIGHNMGTTNYTPSVSFVGSALAAVVSPSYSSLTTTNFVLNLSGTGISGGEPLRWSVISSP